MFVRGAIVGGETTTLGRGRALNALGGGGRGFESDVEFDVEEEDLEEDMYTALCRKIQSERERKCAHFAARAWWKGRDGVDEVKKAAKDVWSIIY